MSSTRSGLASPVASMWAHSVSAASATSSISRCSFSRIFLQPMVLLPPASGARRAPPLQTECTHVKSCTCLGRAAVCVAPRAGRLSGRARPGGCRAIMGGDGGWEGGAMAGTDEGRVILALDQGTTSSRAIVFAGDGRCAASRSRRSRALPADRLGRAGPAGDLGGAARDGRGGAAPQRDGRRRVAAIGITNQRETTILWDRRTAPIAPAIVWQDRRTAHAARSCAPPAASTSSAAGPACCSIRISPPPRSPGCSTTSRAPGRAPSAASSPSAPSTPG